MATLPEGVGLSVAMQYTEKPTNTFLIDWTSRQIAGMDAGLAAMRQAVEIILRNERFRWQIYTSNFGSELESLPGEEYEFIVSEIPRRVRDACSVDHRILSADAFEFSKNLDGSVTCFFTVNTVFGAIREEMTV